ncbi:MAG: LLM class flavin-dependent oxidoreductase [Candidatus Rokuibacteriota bacterium]|nr:MAG: LLM class flavin-dependent oxidoreductase [Candidatus Rokubacteria bacterium]PYN29269.1 MAG: LLM class flavin-dependent oxidoreductase [Candidatus Rokubacteria bacterium]
MPLAAYLNPGTNLGAAVDLARTADRLGYDSVWVTHGAGRDSFVVLAAYAAATTRVGLGNGVVPVYPRHPVAMAQSALTLNEVSGGRFRLGIGVSHKTSMEAMLGLRLVEPLAVMREYVAVLRGALGAGSEFEGRHYRVRWAMAVPTRPPAPPIYLAALSVKMLELAGEIADGVVLWLCPPAYVRDVAVPALERGRRRAGKPLAGFEVVAAVPLAVTDARAAAMAAFRAELKRYLEQPFYRAMMQAAGLGDGVTAFDRGGEAPESLADALGGIGDARAARAYVEAYRKAGVTLPAVRPITFPDAPWYRRTVEEAAAW